MQRILRDNRIIDIVFFEESEKWLAKYSVSREHGTYKVPESVKSAKWDLPNHFEVPQNHIAWQSKCVISM